MLYGIIFNIINFFNINIFSKNDFLKFTIKSCFKLLSITGRFFYIE